MKAMRGRLALQKHFVQNHRCVHFVSSRSGGTLGVRARPRVAFGDSKPSSIDQRCGCGRFICPGK